MVIINHGNHGKYYGTPLPQTCENEINYLLRIFVCKFVILRLNAKNVNVQVFVFAVECLLTNVKVFSAAVECF